MDSTLEIERLAERITAQVQAHEKYSQAFIKILDTLDEIDENIKKSDDLESQHIRDVISQIVQVAEELRHHDSRVKDLKSDLDRRIDEYKSETDKLVDELFLQRHLVENVLPALKSMDEEWSGNYTKIVDLLQDVKGHIVKLVETTSQNQIIDCERLDSLMEEIVKINSKIKTLDEISDYVEFIYQAHKQKNQVWKNFAIYGSAIAMVFVFIQALIQLGIIKIVFYPK